MGLPIKLHGARNKLAGKSPCKTRRDGTASKKHMGPRNQHVALDPGGAIYQPCRIWACRLWIGCVRNESLTPGDATRECLSETPFGHQPLCAAGHVAHDKRSPFGTKTIHSDLRIDSGPRAPSLQQRYTDATNDLDAQRIRSAILAHLAHCCPPTERRDSNNRPHE